MITKRELEAYTTLTLDWTPSSSCRYTVCIVTHRSTTDSEILQTNRSMSSPNSHSPKTSCCTSCYLYHELSTCMVRTLYSCTGVTYPICSILTLKDPAVMLNTSKIIKGRTTLRLLSPATRRSFPDILSFCMNPLFQVACEFISCVIRKVGRGNLRRLVPLLPLYVC